MVSCSVSLRPIQSRRPARSAGAGAVVVEVLMPAILGPGGQAPVAPDTSKIGPQVGAAVPAFEGTDQFGKPHTLASTYGPKGAMLVFFRSADW